jgi:DNA-binding GntR family transcriptional regulator
MLKPLKKQNLGLEAASQIRQLIIVGQLKPGDKLVERELELALNISRTPIRDALKILSSEGFISQIGKSLVVNRLNVDEIDQLYPLIANLEVFLMNGIDNWDRSTIKQLRDINKQLSNPSNSVEQLVDIDVLWHTQLLKQHKNKKASEMLHSLRLLACRYDYAFFMEFSDIQQSVNEHEEIIQLLEKSQTEVAIKALTKHWLDPLAQLKATVLGLTQ